MMKLNAKQMKEVKEYIYKLQISEKDAIELWMFDNDMIDNEEVNKMEAMAKEMAIATKHKGSAIDKVKNLKAKKKGDDEKEGVIKAIFDFLRGSDVAVKPQEIATTKMSFQGTDGGWYTVTITKNKTKPDGYSEE